MISLTLKFQSFKTAVMYIHLFLKCRSLKSLSFIFNLSLFLYDASIFCLEHDTSGTSSLYFGQPERPILMMHLIVAFIVAIFLKKFYWWMKIHFQFHFFAIYSISGYAFSIVAWKVPSSSWSPSDLAMFFKNDA